MYCPRCDRNQDSGKHCAYCGSYLQEKKNCPYIGKNIDAALFRITIPPFEEEYMSEDGIWEDARHSCWGDGGVLPTEPTFERLKSTVGPKEYPYICGHCKEYVAEHAEGRCNGCGKQEWIKREETDNG